MRGKRRQNGIFYGNLARLGASQATTIGRYWETPPYHHGTYPALGETF